MGLLNDFFGGLLGPPKEATVKAPAKKAPAKKTATAAPPKEIAKPHVPKKPASKKAVAATSTTATKVKAKPKKVSRRATQVDTFEIPDRQGDARVVLPRTSINNLKEAVAAVPRVRSYGPLSRVGFLSSRPKSYKFWLRTPEEEICIAETALEANQDGRGDMLLEFELVRSIAAQKPLFADIVRRGTTPDTMLDVEAHKSKTNVASMTAAMGDIDDFPVRKAPPIGAIEVENLFAAILEAKTFCSSEGGRYCMNGVHIDGRKQVVVATDGKRLHCVPFKAHGELPFDKTTVHVEMKLRPGKPFGISGEAVTWDEDSKILYLLFKNGYWATMSVPGEFPDWEAVIPRGHPVEWRLDEETREEFAQLVKDAPTGRGALSLALRVSGDEVDVSARDDGRTFGFTMKNQTIVGAKSKTIELGLSPTFLLEIIQNVRLDTVKIRDHKAGVIFEGDRLKHILMPIQLV